MLALLDLAREARVDALWLTRSQECQFRLPDLQVAVSSIAVEGDTNLFQDTRTPVCVEVIELHNHVLKTLMKLESAEDDLYVEVHFTEQREFCLVLCKGDSEPAAAPVYRWMANFFSRRLF